MTVVVALLETVTAIKRFNSDRSTLTGTDLTVVEADGGVGVDVGFFDLKTGVPDAGLTYVRNFFSGGGVDVALTKSGVLSASRFLIFNNFVTEALLNGNDKSNLTGFVVFCSRLVVVSACATIALLNGNDNRGFLSGNKAAGLPLEARTYIQQEGN